MTDTSQTEDAVERVAEPEATTEPVADEARPLRITALMIIVGLVLEALMLVDLTPATFVLFAFVGAPVLVFGMIGYLIFVVRELKKRRAL